MDLDLRTFKLVKTKQKKYYFRPCLRKVFYIEIYIYRALQRSCNVNQQIQEVETCDVAKSSPPKPSL